MKIKRPAIREATQRLRASLSSKEQLTADRGRLGGPVMRMDGSILKNRACGFQSQASCLGILRDW